MAGRKPCDWKAICDANSYYAKEQTRNLFGYDYPKTGTYQIVLLCSKCERVRVVDAKAVHRVNSVCFNCRDIAPPKKEEEIPYISPPQYRKCLKCDDEFFSHGQRICSHCSKINKTFHDFKELL